MLILWFVIHTLAIMNNLFSSVCMLGIRTSWYNEMKVKVDGMTTGADAERLLELYSEAHKTTWHFWRGGTPGTHPVAYRVFTQTIQFTQTSSLFLLNIINLPMYRRTR